MRTLSTALDSWQWLTIPFKHLIKHNNSYYTSYISTHNFPCTFSLKRQLPHLVSTFTPFLTFSSLTLTHQPTILSCVSLSIPICSNIHQAMSTIYDLTMLSLGSRDLSPRAINQETELCAFCPLELIISSIGKKAWILLLEQSENKSGVIYPLLLLFAL